MPNISEQRHSNRPPITGPAHTILLNVALVSADALAMETNRKKVNLKFLLRLQNHVTGVSLRYRKYGYNQSSREENELLAPDLHLNLPKFSEV